MKDFDTFSFRPEQRDQSEPSSRKSIEQQQVTQAEPKHWQQMTYRFEHLSPISPSISQSDYINKKIMKIDEQLSENIKRRIELERRLYKQKQAIRESENEKYFKQQKVISDEKAIQTYTNMQMKSDSIEKLLQHPKRETNHIPLKVDTKMTKEPHSSLVAKKKVIPEQIRVQSLLKKATFPELPRENLEKLEKQLHALSLNSEHSDIIYMLMAVNFHMGRHHKVRKYFAEIQMFKIFEVKSFWIACESEFELENYELCIKLADKCMKEISDQHFPRFVFLQARSYERIGNFINSIVCYNQLIKMRPKVADFYLERGLIYDKIGYPRQAKEDYAYFGVLKKDASEYLKDKILAEKSEIKRKQMVKALAKIS